LEIFLYLVAFMFCSSGNRTEFTLLSTIWGRKIMPFQLSIFTAQTTQKSQSATQFGQYFLHRQAFETVLEAKKHWQYFFKTSGINKKL